MQPIKIGVLSDTHHTKITPQFQQKIALCFAECTTIIHAGDLTSPAITEVFNGKKLHAVHGNMCDIAVKKKLPTKKTITVGKFKIGIIHHCGQGYDFESQLIDQFDAVDCIIYGHTHRPICRLIGQTMYLNPGSFRSTGQYGSPGTYAIIEAGADLRATLHHVPVLA